MILRICVVMVAAAAAVAPLPPWWVERVYSTSIYPAIQRTITPLSNLVPLALLDVAVAMLLAAIVVLSVRRVRRSGVLAGMVRGAVVALTWSAVFYLWFFALWGLNYRRVPLTARLDYDGARVTPEAVASFTGAAVGIVNREYSAAHASRNAASRASTGPSPGRTWSSSEAAGWRRRAARPAWRCE